MLAEERFGQILNLLSKQRTATVQELCEALGTSESTIRRAGLPHADTPGSGSAPRAQRPRRRGQNGRA